MPNIHMIKPRASEAITRKWWNSMSSNSGVLELPQSLPGLMAPPVPQSWAPSLQSTASSMELRLEFVGGEFGVTAEGTGRWPIAPPGYRRRRDSGCRQRRDGTSYCGPVGHLPAVDP